MDSNKALIEAIIAGAIFAGADSTGDRNSTWLPTTQGVEDKDIDAQQSNLINPLEPIEHL